MNQHGKEKVLKSGPYEGVKLETDIIWVAPQNATEIG